MENAVACAKAVRKSFTLLSQDFPADMQSNVALDTTAAVSADINDILTTLVIALALVIVVVYIFLQGWRATLIPLLAVPVALIATFMVFPAWVSPSIRSPCLAWYWPSGSLWTMPSSWSRL